jgi:hypothetical protein
MQPFRGALIDDAGQVIAEIEGSIQTPDETQGPRRGNFELEEDGSFMQGVLEGKTFHLKVDEGSQLAIHVESVSTSTRPGYTKADFSSS